MLFIWSAINRPLKATLKRIQDPVQQVQVKILYFVFLLNFVKISGFIAVAIFENDSKKLFMGAVAFILTTVILKYLLSKPKYLNLLVHCGILTGTFFLFNSIFYIQSGLTLLTIQSVFMISMWSFYALDGKWGFFYSILAVIPLFYSMIFNGNIQLPVDVAQRYFLLFMTVINLCITFTALFYYRNFLFNTIATKDQLFKALQEVNENQRMFFSSMSHELRTPLNAVVGMTNLLIDDNENKEQKENLDILKFSAENLLSLINNILDINKFDLGKVELEKIKFNLSQLLQNAFAGLKVGAKEKNLDFILTIDPLLENKNILGDPTRLLQIILNLGSNAIKFTKKGHVKIEVIALEKIEERVTLRFSVTDTGLGMTEEEQQTIFDPFKQASVGTLRKYGGTGLGLSIVKKLVHLHGSSIFVKSELHLGTSFYFDVNYALSAAVAEVNRTIIPLMPSSAEVSGLRILLAEDNMMNIFFMKKLFSKWGIRLDVAENGLEAVKLLEDKDYDLILMDLQMPVMDGYEATVCIRKMFNPVKANVYIMALTAAVSEDLNLRVTHAGMNDILGKPFRPEQLYEKLKHLPVNSFHADLVSS